MLLAGSYWNQVVCGYSARNLTQQGAPMQPQPPRSQVVSESSWPASQPPRPPRDFSSVWKVLIIISLLLAVAALTAGTNAMSDYEIRQIAAEEAQGRVGPRGPMGPQGPAGEQATGQQPAGSTEVPTESPIETPPTPAVRPTLKVPASAVELVAWAEDSIVRVEAGRSQGSGFVFAVSGDTAFVVTNNHVVDEQPGQIDVYVRGAYYKGTLLGYDDAPYVDVAVVSICCNALFHALPWEEGGEANPGDLIVALESAPGGGGQHHREGAGPQFVRALDPGDPRRAPPGGKQRRADPHDGRQGPGGQCREVNSRCRPVLRDSVQYPCRSGHGMEVPSCGAAHPDARCPRVTRICGCGWRTIPLQAT